MIGAFGNEVNPRWYRTTHPLGGGEGGDLGIGIEGNPPSGADMFACMHAMVLVWRVLLAEPFATGSEGVATCFYAVPVSTVAHADIVPFCLAGAAHDLSGRYFPVLAANTAGVCGGAASWYRALLRL